MTMASRCSTRRILLAVGSLANREREKRHAARTYFNYNLRLEPTNVCVASCLFCSFARLQPSDAAAYTMSLEQAWDKLRRRANQPLTELHIVNGLNPHLPFSYYTEMLRGFKRIRPEIHLKCFTAVEIAFFADLYKMSDEQVLRELMDAGLDSLPGGGAEIFAERVRRKICHDKCGADRYLDIHRIAHRLGLRTNVTMLYGHIETMEERVDHMMRARALQDETGGFQAFIPLAFHPDNNQMRKLPAPSAADTLRVHAVARLMCDNIPHIKAFWIATGRGRGADRALVRRRRPRRHRAGREDLPHGRIADARGDDDGPADAPGPRRRPRTARARHALQHRERPRRGLLTYRRPFWAYIIFPRPMASMIPLLTEFENEHISERQALPEKYLGLSDAEMDARIAAARATLGNRLVILGHHYQRDEVIRFADYTGDSYPARESDRVAPRSRLHRVLRRALHGGERRRPVRSASAGDPAGPRRRLLDGRHGGARSARDVLGRADADGRAPRQARGRPA